MMDEEVSEVVDLVHSLVIQSRPTPGPLEEALASRTPSKITAVKSVPSSPCINSIPRSQTVPVRKKVQIKSAPLRPPDIGNSSLFPSVEEAALQDAAMTPRRSVHLFKSTPISNNKWGGKSLNNGASSSDIISSPDGQQRGDSERDKKLKTLEAKLTGRLGFQQDESQNGNVTVRRASLTSETPALTPTRKTPRSGKLYAELSPERRQKLDELSEKYSKSIDHNQCRSILDELEFLFQLFNSNSVMKMVKESEIPLLSSSAEQAYFVIKIVINQLDKLFVSIPSSILQLINENYPHKIPKPVRKHIEDWIASQKSKRSRSGSLNDAIPIDFAKTVTFKSEKDGRANFLQQTDFHNFCKQRDLFYAIREVWTSNGGGNGGNAPSDGGIINDRSKARMSFPPVQGGGYGSKYVDTFPLKVQSLFQLNQNPTNLFHLASLFVSHYLLEARALEVGGVPKDDTMKEFFQSNPMKLLQLNSRFSTTAQETLESDQSSNLAFRKQFLLLSSGKFVQHVVDRLVMEITKIEGSMECADLANPGHVSRNIKDAIHLARLLGFAHCLPYLSDDKNKQAQAHAANINSIEKESVMREHALFRSYQTPPADLKYFVEKASKSGRLTASCPWVIEYLLQCDPVALLLPSYQPLLITIIHLYRTMLSQRCKSPLSESNKNFLRFYFGQLFSSKTFPDAVFVQLTSKQLSNESGNDLPQCDSVQEVLLDSMEDVGRNLIEFSFEETFNRFKRILSWGKLEVSNTAITGDFRHIRPIPAPEKSTASSDPSKLVCKEKMVQTKLEASFFELYSPSIKRSVDFIAERMASNFITVAKTHLFPNFRNILANQGVFGVRAAEKCRLKLGEEMNKYLTEKCCATVKVFLEPAVSIGVLGICQRVAIRKAKENGAEWIQNYINAGMFPNTLDNSDAPEPLLPTTVPTQPSTPSQLPTEPEEPPFEILILVHKMLRKLNSREKVDPVHIDKVLSCQSFSKAQWAFSSLIDWGMSLITYQPQDLNLLRMKQLVNIWKGLWTPTANILNPRNLMILAQSKGPRDSWIKLGSVTQILITEGIIKTDNLEQQCFYLLRDDWPDDIQKRISEYLTIVKEAFEGKAEWNSESGQVLDWVAWLCSGQPDQD